MANTEASSRPDSLLIRSMPVLFLFLWPTGFIALKVGLTYAEPLTFLAWRYGILLVILVPAWLWLRPALPASRSQWCHIGMVGLLIQAGYFGFAYLCMQHGMSATSLALIASQQPILVGLLAPVIAGEKVGLKRWLGLLMGVGGAMIVIISKSSGSDANAGWLSLLFGVLSLLCITTATFWEKKHVTPHHPVSVYLIQYSVGFLATLPFALLFETMVVQWTQDFILSLGWLIIANSLISMWLLFSMLRRGEASKVSALFFLIPAVAALMASAVGQEQIPLMAWPGMALAAAGIYVVNRSAQLPKPQSSQ